MWAGEQVVRYFVGVVHSTLAGRPNTSETNARVQARQVHSGDQNWGCFAIDSPRVLSHEQVLRAEENAGEVFGKRRCIYSGTKREREVNSCWRRSPGVSRCSELPEDCSRREVRGSGKFSTLCQGISR